MSHSCSELARFRGSVYALNVDSKQWARHGNTANIIILRNEYDAVLRWSNDVMELNWSLLNSHMKTKGERALVLRAMVYFIHSRMCLPTPRVSVKSVHDDGRN